MEAYRSPRVQLVDDLPADRSEVLAAAVAAQDCRRAVMGLGQATEELSRKSYLLGELIALLSTMSLADLESIVGDVLRVASVKRQRERLAETDTRPPAIATAAVITDKGHKQMLQLAVAKRSISWAFVSCIVLAVASVATAFCFAYSHYSASQCWSDRGDMGDFWGGHLSAGVGLASTFLFLAALLLQRDELQLQRKELIESREIAQKQQETLEAQHTTLAKQNNFTFVYNVIQSAQLLARYGTGVTIDLFVRTCLYRIQDVAEHDRQHALDLVRLIATAFVSLSNRDVLEKVINQFINDAKGEKRTPREHFWHQGGGYDAITHVCKGERT